LLHGLHPLDVDARIQRALDQVRAPTSARTPAVCSTWGVSDGVARLRLEGSCHGCPSSTVTVQLAIEGAVQDAAPEVTEVGRGGHDRPARAEAAADRGPRPGAGASPRGPPGRRGRAASGIVLPDIGPAQFPGR